MYSSQPEIGFTPASLAAFDKLDRAKDVAVVGHGDRRHVEFLDALDELARSRMLRRAWSNPYADADGRIAQTLLLWPSLVVFIVVARDVEIRGRNITRISGEYLRTRPSPQLVSSALRAKATRLR